MTTHIRGRFEVKLLPQATDAGVDDDLPARLRLDKRYFGELDASSQGQMLAARSPVEGSAGYVAIERVTGTLDGRRGSFVLQHFGLMDRGKPSLEIAVVPDSGSGELAGLHGRMSIEIRDGEHHYGFEYGFAASE